MKLLSKKLLQQLPPLGATDSDPDPLVICKFFYPDFHWTWYAIEFDGTDIFYGLIDKAEEVLDLGTFTLSEIKSFQSWLGLPLERDQYFNPIRLSELRHKLGL